MATGIAIQIVLGSLVVATTGFLVWYYSNRRSQGHRPLLLDASVKHEVKLIEKEEISQNTRRFRFGLPEDTVLGLSPGQHINLTAVISGSVVVRTYSPVSTNADVGFMDLIVKIYFKDTHPKFPNGGKMSQFLNNMKPGDAVHIRGPAGKMVYNTTNSEFLIRTATKSPPRSLIAKQINMIAGGSGITPMLQILHAVFPNQLESSADSQPSVSLIFANQTEDDILCRSYLEKIARKHPNKLKLWYTLSQPPEDWSLGVGRVSGSMFQSHLFPPSDDGVQLLCGPNPMVQSCLAILKDLNYEIERCYVY